MGSNNSTLEASCLMYSSCFYCAKSTLSNMDSRLKFCEGSVGKLGLSKLEGTSLA